MSIWNASDFEPVSIVLDFTSWGSGHHAATAIDVTGVRLCNAIQLVNVENAVSQVEVCSHCGYTHCMSGGWVAFRRVGDGVVWIPAWHEMGNGEREISEYRPPPYIESWGAPFFDMQAWERLRRLNQEFPPGQELLHITSRETVPLPMNFARASLTGVSRCARIAPRTCSRSN